MVTRAGSLAPLLALLLLAAPAGADQDDEIAAGLKEAGKSGAIGRRIHELEKELKGSNLWVHQAVVLMELGDMKDRRAVRALAWGLTAKHRHVSAFALHSLYRVPKEDLKKGGGEPLVEGLIAALKVKTKYHRRVARELLTIIVGEDLGKKQSKWKRWLKKHGGELEIEIADTSFDSSKYDPKDVQRVMTGLGDSGTQVRDRIPNVTSEISELRDNGIDIVLCLDETSSMRAVIDETKSKMDVLLTVVSQVVEDNRVGLITYNDAVKTNEPLTKNTGKLRETIQTVQAVGGEDMPEGVDKALAVALAPKFGWRRDSAKTVVVLGDAPPHDGDIASNLETVKLANKRLGITVNTVSTGPIQVSEFADIAKAGGGTDMILAEPNKLVSEILLLVFGEKLRPAMERFVPVIVEILADG